MVMGTNNFFDFYNAIDFCFVQKIDQHFCGSRDNHNKKDIFFIFYQSFFGEIIIRTPISAPLRILIISWCVYSLLITAVFSGKMISSFVQTNRKPEIYSIDKLLNLNYTIYSTNVTVGLKTEMEFTQNQIIEIEKACSEHLLSDDKCFDYHLQIHKVKNHIEKVNEVFHRMNYIEGSHNDFIAFINNNANHSKYAYVMSKLNDDKIIRRYYNYGKQKFADLRLVYYVHMPMAYINRFNELLSMLAATGYLSYWIKITKSD